MNNLIRLILVPLFLLISLIAFSQVEVSKVKKVIDGKSYYMHTVAKGETLYGICNAYTITKEELALENAELFNGLQPGMELKIPVKDAPYVEDKNFTVHTVAKGETLYGIAKKYKLDVNELVSYNPEAANGLKIDQKLRIPKENKVTPDYQVTKDAKYIFHVVERQQTLYSLSKQYEVTQEQIFNENPGLEQAGLKVGEVIKIPNPHYAPPKLVFPTDSLPEVIDTAKQVIPVVVDKKPCETFNYKEYNKPFRIALFIPLYLGKNSGVEVKKAIKEEEKFYPGTIFIEYYEGILLAVDSMRRLGINVELNVYDVAKDSSRMEELLKNDIFKQVDLIIGPFYEKNLEIVSEFALANNITVVSPRAVRTDNKNDNSRILYLNPSNEVLMRETAKKLASRENLNLIYVHLGKEEEQKMITLYKEEIDIYLAEHPEKTITHSAVVYNEKGQKGITASLITGKDNVVIIPAIDRSFVLSFLNSFYPSVKDLLKTSVSIVGMPVWTRYDNIEVENLHDLQLHLPESSYIDYKDPGVKKFIKTYRAVYKTEPSVRSFQGFDMMVYFLSVLREYGKDFQDCLGDYNTQLLHTSYKFTKESETSGYENRFIYILVYDKEYNVIPMEDFLKPVEKK